MNKDNAKDYLPLVQALADGKVIQGHMYRSQQWEDMDGDIAFDGPPSDYRIKPEPREIWVVNEPSFTESSLAFHSKEAAIEYIGTRGYELARYREVVE